MATQPGNGRAARHICTAVHHLRVPCIPVEIYFCGEGIAQVCQPGLFHYDIQDFSLRQLRGEDASCALLPQALAFRDQKMAGPHLFSAVYFSEAAWKYRKRAFRYVLLDTGHLLENLVSSLAYVGHGCSVRYDFDDKRLCSLVGLDRSQRGLFCHCGCSSGQDPGTATEQSVSRLNL